MVEAAIRTKRVSLTALSVEGPVTPAYADVLSSEALDFVAALCKRFGSYRNELLAFRVKRQHRLDAGERPDFIAETRVIRERDWTVAPPPPDLMDRRVEIPSPPRRKMVIEGLNSAARVYIADFEDASSPTWEAMMEGQLNVRDAVARTIDCKGPFGQRYGLRDRTATLMVRPRGWHLCERHVLFNGEAIPAALFDFGIFFYHNAKRLMAQGSGPYLYLPKLESHLEARLWNDVFVYAQDALGVPQGTIRATVLIETVLAAFEMDEILFELREHAAGLNCGRWDYLFSFIKCFRSDPQFVLPERNRISMASDFMRAYSDLLVKTCHRRGTHAIGGMAVQIPVNGDPHAHERALAELRADKEREVLAGHDGTWVAHPALIPVALEVFDRHMPGPHQIHCLREDVQVGAAELLDVRSDGRVTAEGLQGNIDAALRYTEAWLMGQGCVPVYNRMEDAATAELARAQLWQAIRYSQGVLEDGRRLTREVFREGLSRALGRIEVELGPERFCSRRFAAAAGLLDDWVTSAKLPAFLTLEAYGLLS
jgi:malate synthase